MHVRARAHSAEYAASHSVLVFVVHAWKSGAASFQVNFTIFALVPKSLKRDHTRKHFGLACRLRDAELSAPPNPVSSHLMQQVTGWA